MSTVPASPQRAREALSKIRPVLESPQSAHRELHVLRQESEPAAHTAEAARARLRVPAGAHTGKSEEAAKRLAVERADGTISLVNGIGLLMRLSRTMHTLTIPHLQLAFFAGFLRYCGVLPKEQAYTLEEQEILHKCAFIARAFGLDLGYEWHLHEYGTSSSFLAADHVELVDGKMQVDFGEIVALEAVPGYLELAEDMRDGMPLLSAPFEADRFISLVLGRDRAWLSVASAIVHEKGSCPDESLPARVACINSDCDEKTARRVMGEIESSRPPAWEAGSAGAGRGA